MSRKTILLVDDEEETRRMLRLFLTHNMYDVIEAENGREALEILEAKRPGLVIIDVWMPDLDGFDTVRQIRVKASSAQLPVLYFTSINSAEAERKGMALGAQGFLSKPVSLTRLLKCIEDLTADALNQPAS